MNAQATTIGMGDDPNDGRENVERVTWYRRVSGYVLIMISVFLFVYSVMKLQDPETLPIKHVQIKGQFKHLSTSGLQERAIEVVRGGFFNVNVETVQSVLLEEPWIRKVSVKRVWPDRLTVSIREQTAIASWNGTALLNEKGSLFSPERNTFPAHIPNFKGPEGTHSQLLDFYRKLQGALPEDLRIAEITLSERRAWHVGFVNGPHVYLGRTNIVNRLNRFIEFVPPNLGSVFNNIRSIDVRYTNGFAVRWEPRHKPDL